MSSLTREVYGPKATVNRYTVPVPIAKGGTGATDIVTAVENLGGVPLSKANQPNGWAQTDSNNLLPASIFPIEASGGPTIEGPDQLLIQSTGVYRITNYDSTDVYTITAAQGIVSHVGDTIYYTAPSIPGNYGFVVNDKAVSVTINYHYVNQPTILTPANTQATLSNSIPTDTVVANDRVSDDNFGYSCAISSDGSRLVVSAVFKSVNSVINAGQVYVFTRVNNAWVQESIITASDYATNAYFGINVSISADGSRIAVGSSGKTVSGLANAGQVYIYVRDSSLWLLESIITAADKATNDLFGASVSLNGLGTRLVVGAYAKTVSGSTNAGQVYIYTRSGITWTQETTLTAPDRVTNDLFGLAVNIASDNSRLVVSAYNKTVNGVVGAGQVYIYTLNGASWVLDVTLSAADKATNDHFGTQLCLFSGANRLLISSVNKVINNIQTVGKVYVYIKTSLGWILETTINNTDISYNSLFGIGLAITADNLTLVVGVPGIDSIDIPNCGGVVTYQLEYDNTSVNKQQSNITFTSSAFSLTGQPLESTLTASDKATNDYFGSAVSISADGSRMAVGAYGKTVTGLVGAGQVYVYAKSGLTWAQESIIIASDGVAGDNFGRSVSFDSTGNRLVIGANIKTVSGITSAGQVYVYVRSNNVYILESTLLASDRSTGDQFGVSASLNSDGSRLLVGAHVKTVSGIAGAGKVYSYIRSGSAWIEDAQITAADKTTNDHFGISVSFSADSSRVAIGAWNKTVGGLINAGQIYIYTRSSSVYTQEAILTAFDAATGDTFGFSVTLNSDGSRLAVGAPGKTINSITSAGKIYIYTRTGTTWALETTMVSLTVATSILFAFSLNFSSDTKYLIVGAVGVGNPDYSVSGAVYTYDMSFHEGTDWQLATDPGFTNIVKSTTNDSLNKLSWQVLDLTQATDYYVRCRHKGTVYGYSEWSNTNKLRTSDFFVPIFETTLLKEPTVTASDAFGVAVSLSSDGSRLAVGAHQKTVGGVTGAGQVFVYTRSGTTWSLEATLSAADKATNDYFGLSLTFDGGANRLVISSFNKTVSGVTSAGQVYIYVRSGTTWSLENTLTAYDKAAGDLFGVNVSLSGDGARMAVGAYGKDVAGVTDAGKVYTYTRSGITWTLESEIIAADKATSDNFGRGVSFNNDSTLLLISAYNKTVSGVTSAGQIYLYSRVANGYTLLSTFSAADKVSGDYFGESVELSKNGNLAVIGSSRKTVSGITNAGQAYYYELDGNTFTQITTVSALIKAANDYFAIDLSLTQDGAIMAAGAFLRDTDGITDSGAVYIFY